jgi:hypothetical protein
MISQITVKTAVPAVMIRASISGEKTPVIDSSPLSVEFDIIRIPDGVFRSIFDDSV